MPFVSQLVARPAAAEVLQGLAAVQDSAFTRPALEDSFRSWGAPDPPHLIDAFLEANLLAQFGDRIGLSVFGVRTALLVEAINGGDIEDVFRRLRRVTGVGEPYELVKEGMTRLFFESLLQIPGFRRLYICSPWVHPSQREAACFHYAALKMEEHTGRLPEVLILTRPPACAPKGAEDGLDPFVKLGAQVFFHRRLHSKLYIREPGPSGGCLMAVVG
jgi:hypothetical protein